MLSPEYLQDITDGAEEIASQLHSDIINLIVKRISERLSREDGYLFTSQDKWQIDSVQQAGYMLDDITKVISERTGIMESELKSAMRDAGIETLNNEDEVYIKSGLSPTPLMQSPEYMRLMERNYLKTFGTWKNYTGTTASSAQSIFINACDNAYIKVTAGATSYTKAFLEAIEEVAKTGITTIDYNGYRQSLESATLRAIRTGISQMSSDITNKRMDEMNWDTILVSAHMGARYGDGGENLTNHAWWQGKFYSKSGMDKRFPPYSVCGEGNVRGIHGANCRHTHGAGDGEHNPYDNIDTEENRKVYDLTQKQRSMERSIRNDKRRLQALDTGIQNAQDEQSRFEVQQRYDELSDRIKSKNKEYNEFCKENGLRPLRERLKIAQEERKIKYTASKS